MRRPVAHGTFVLALFLLFAAVGSGAEAQPATRQDGLIQLSTPSFQNLVTALDAFVDAARQGVRYPIPSHMADMAAQAYMPLSPDVWDWNGEIHVVASASLFPLEKNHAIIIKVPDYPKFLDTLKQLVQNWELNTGDACLHVDFPHLGEYLVAQSGNERVILAKSPEILAFVRKALAGGWAPRTEDALLAEFTFPRSWRHMKPLAQAFVKSKLAEAKVFLNGKDASFIPHSLRTAGLATLDEVETVLTPAVLAVAETIERFAVTFRIDAGQLTFTTATEAVPGSPLGKSIAALGKEDGSAGPMARFAGEGAETFVIGRSMDTLYPGFSAKFVESAGRVMARAFPKQKDEFDRLGRELLRYTPERQAVAEYRNDKGGYTVVWQQTSDAEKLAAAMVDACQLYRDVMSAVMPGYEQYVDLVITPGKTAEGNAYQRLGIQTPFLEVIEALIASDDADGTFGSLVGLDIPGFIRNFAVYIASRDGYAVLTGGMAGETELDEALGVIAKGARRPLLEGAPARQAMTGLRHRQYSQGVIGAEALYLQMVEGVAKGLLKGGFPADSALKVVERLNEMAPYSGSDEFLGISAGSDGTRFTVEGSFPVDSVNVLARNLAEMFNVLPKALMDVMMEESLKKQQQGAEEDEEYLEEDGAEEEIEEEVAP